MTKPKYSNDSLLAPKVAPTRSWPAAYLAAWWNILVTDRVQGRDKRPL